MFDMRIHALYPLTEAEVARRPERGNLGAGPSGACRLMCGTGGIVPSAVRADAAEQAWPTAGVTASGSYHRAGKRSGGVSGPLI